MKKEIMSRKNIEALCPCLTCRCPDSNCEDECPKLLEYKIFVDEYEGRQEAERLEAAAAHRRDKKRYKNNDYGKLAKEKRTNWESIEEDDE